VAGQKGSHIKLERPGVDFFGTTAEFWLNLQSLYEIRLAERKAGKSIRALPTLKRFEQVHA